MTALPRFVVHLLSGGMDSVALLYCLLSQNCKVHCLLFRYGQRHEKELEFARKHCERTNTPYTEVELSRIKFLFSRSALTDGEGTNIVPNRNAVFLHIAAAIAASQGAESVTIACNKDDQAGFPDTTHDFIDSINASLKSAKIGVEVCAPFIGMTKRQIVQMARKEGWPICDSMSCYSGTNCGECDACQKRREAME